VNWRSIETDLKPISLILDHFFRAMALTNLKSIVSSTSLLTSLTSLMIIVVRQKGSPTLNYFCMFVFIHSLYLRPYSHETFWPTILRKKDIFEPWMSKDQGKLLTKKIKVHKQNTVSRYVFLNAYLGWSIETCVSKLPFYNISFYRNIVCQNVSCE